MLRAGVEDAGQDVIQVIRHGEDGLEKIPGLGIGSVCRVLERGLLPRVTPTGQVDQDNSEAPNIIRGAHVIRLPGRGVQTF